MVFANATDFLAFSTSQLKNLTVEIAPVNVKSIDYDRAQLKQCFNNAYRYISDSGQDLVYVLGYILVHGVSIEHAWIRSGSTHLDVTLASSGTRLYFKVCEIQISLLDEYVIEAGHAPDLYAMNKFLGSRKAAAAI